MTISAAQSIEKIKRGLNLPHVYLIKPIKDIHL